VLDLGEEDSPRVKLLVTNSNDTADYVALSHFWGSPNAVPKTTRANLQSNLESIRISELPETFRDAILLLERSTSNISGSTHCALFKMIIVTGKWNLRSWLKYTQMPR
jgi:hypothetical protein